MPPRLAIPRQFPLHSIPKTPPPPPIQTHPAPRRTFFPLPTGSQSLQRFTARKSLPYPPRALFNLVSDINAYQHFLPYCLSSNVTRTCPQTNLPTEATLRVGWGSFDETFASVVACSPEAGTVEANGDRNELFERLVTRWAVKRGEGEEGTLVELFLEFGFRNPLYAAVSSAVAPKVAEIMIQAFEKRAGEVLGGESARGGRGEVMGGGE